MVTVMALYDKLFMIKFSHLEVYICQHHIKMNKIKGLKSKKKSPMYDPKNPPLCTNGRMNWPSGHGGIMWETFEVKRLSFWGIHGLISNSKLNKRAHN